MDLNSDNLNHYFVYESGEFAYEYYKGMCFEAIYGPHDVECIVLNLLLSKLRTTVRICEPGPTMTPFDSLYLKS